MAYLCSLEKKDIRPWNIKILLERTLDTQLLNLVLELYKTMLMVEPNSKYWKNGDSKEVPTEPFTSKSSYPVKEHLSENNS